MHRTIPVFFGIRLLTLSSPSLAQAVKPATTVTSEHCLPLARAEFSRVEDAPGKIITASVTAGAGDLPSYCKVIGYARHDVRLHVRLLMTVWNGKIVIFGAGGQAGDFLPDDPTSPVSSSGSALRQGLATATHNSGYLSNQTDARWAYQNESALLDYGQFRDHGGEQLSYMSWTDAIGGIRDTIDYYSTVERVIGSPEATQKFHRLFMVPGMNHCSGGAGASQIDCLAAFDKWIDGDRAPDTISGYHPGTDGRSAFTRTIRPLPFKTPKIFGARTCFGRTISRREFISADNKSRPRSGGARYQYPI